MPGGAGVFLCAAGINDKATAYAVSYTHLDVYKRQIKTYLENGGHLFVTTDLTVSTPNLDALLAEYGICLLYTSSALRIMRYCLKHSENT